MSTLRFALTVIAILQTHLAEAKEPLLVTRLGGVGSCFAPEEPFPYKLNTTDPLYETAREEHQRASQRGGAGSFPSGAPPTGRGGRGRTTILRSAASAGAFH